MGVCVVKCSMCLEFHRAFHWVKWCTGNDTVMLIWLAIMIAPREETHRDDVLMILAQIASWIIWSVFPSGWDWLLSNNNSTVCMEGGVCNLFLFPFSQLAKPSRLPGSIPYSYSSFLDDVMHAVKVWKAWSKFSWFNLLKSKCNGVLSMPGAFQQHPALFTPIQLYAFTPGSQAVNLQCAKTQHWTVAMLHLEAKSLLTNLNRGY